MEETNQTIHETTQGNKILKHSVRTKYLDVCKKVLLISATSGKHVIAIKHTAQTWCGFIVRKYLWKRAMTLIPTCLLYSEHKRQGQQQIITLAKQQSE